MKPYVTTNKTPQENLYEDAPQEQSTSQHNTTTHEQQRTLDIQNLSNPSNVITNIQPSLTITTDPNLLDIPTRHLTEHERNTQQIDDTSTISTSKTNIT